MSLVALHRLASARGSSGLLLLLGPGEAKRIASDLWRSLRGVAAGTQAFALQICRNAGKSRNFRPPALPVRVPKSADRTDARWYSTRAKGGSARLALLRAFKRLAVSELPLVEAHVGRRESALFRRHVSSRGGTQLAVGQVTALDFRVAVERWINLVTAKATWLTFRLAEVALAATGDPNCARETARVCRLVASRRRLYDPFNTLAAFLEAFHHLAAESPARLAALLDARSGASAFCRIALKAGVGKRWRSTRARELLRAEARLKNR